MEAAKLLCPLQCLLILDLKHSIYYRWLCCYRTEVALRVALFPVVKVAVWISAPELAGLSQPAALLAGAMGLSVLRHETGDSPHSVGQKGEGESASESCRLSAEPDLSVMLQATSLLWCAVKHEATSISWRRQGI